MLCAWNGLIVINIFRNVMNSTGPWGSVVLLVGRSRDRFPVVSLGIFSVVPPTEPCVLRSTRPLKVSTTDFSWGKGGRCVWLTTYYPCSAETSRKSGALPTRNPLGHLGLSRETFTLLMNSIWEGTEEIIWMWKVGTGIILKSILWKRIVTIWTWFIWIMAVTNGRLLRTQ